MTKRTTAIIIASVIIISFVVIAIWAAAFRDVDPIVYAQSVEFVDLETGHVIFDFEENPGIVHTVRVRVLPENTTDKRVLFASTAPSVQVTIDETDPHVAHIKMLEIDGSAVITATTRDGTDLTASLVAIDSTAPDRVLTFNPDTSTFDPDRGVHEFALGQYAFYVGFTYRFYGINSITSANNQGAGANGTIATVYGVQVLSFTEEGNYALVFALPSGPVTVNVRVVYRLAMFTPPASFNHDNYVIGSRNAMNFNLVMLKFPELTPVAAHMNVATYNAMNDAVINIIDDITGDVVEFLNQDFGTKIRIEFALRYQAMPNIEIEFTLQDGYNVWNLTQLRQRFADLSAVGVMMHSSVTIVPSDVPDFIIPEGQTDAGLLRQLELGVFNRDSVNLFATDVIDFYGNNHTIDYRQLPLVPPSQVGIAQGEIVFAGTSLFNIQGRTNDIDFGVFDLNIIGHTGTPTGANAPNESGGMTAFIVDARRGGALVEIASISLVMENVQIRASNTGIYMEEISAHLYNVTIEDMFSHAINNYNSQVILENSEFRRSGGPLFHVIHRRTYEFDFSPFNFRLPPPPSIDIVGTFIADNWLYGDEAWMMAMGFHLIIPGLKTAAETAFNANFGLTMLRQGEGAQEAFNFIMIFRTYGLNHQGGGSNQMHGAGWTHAWSIDATQKYGSNPNNAVYLIPAGNIPMPASGTAAFASNVGSLSGTNPSGVISFNQDTDSGLFVLTENAPGLGLVGLLIEARNM
ncbi:MAG: hypothetical protein FWE16_02705 [Firmicutes bacterium]|nr:hypothetical protein [Bacillota bacterium]